jgi:hypothetical protein
VTTEQWLPPSRRPDNEAAGWLGYYCRCHLPRVFDLVDADGVVPVVWHYLKAETHTYRLFEEKPSGQVLHPSQERTFRHLVAGLGLSVYVIHNAEWLGVPRFPIEVTRLGSPDQHRTFGRPQFDNWMRDGLCPLDPAEAERWSTRIEEEDALLDESRADREWAAFQAWCDEHPDELGRPFS